MKRKYIATVSALIVVVGGAVTGLVWPTGNTIYGLTIDGHSISHQSMDEVDTYLQERNTQSQRIRIVDAKGKETTVNLTDLGVTIDRVGTLTDVMDYGYESDVMTYVMHRVDALLHGKAMNIRYKVDGPMAESYFMNYAKAMGQVGANATVTLEGNTVVHQPAKVGRKLDVTATMKRLQEQLQEGKVETLELVINESAQPTITDKDLVSITSILGSFTTYFDGSNTSRAHNIHLASQKIHQTFIPAGGIFSFNQVVGERTPEAGYDDAPVFMGGRLVPGIGGGICQVSSTLFNTALLSGMDIVERDTHFAPVSYIPVGLDATVAWGYIDFQFKNPYSHPIYVIAEEGAGYVTITILGAKEDVPQSVTITKGKEQRIPNKKIEKIDEAVKEETVEEAGHEGVSVDTTRTIVYGDGRSSTYTFNSYYEPVDTVIVTGPNVVKKHKEDSSKKNG
ncbi:VanW family protein [Veillonella sp. CHU594]|uniref:VanW family protein n=1 Tax=Veillonella sp. CHU594 TaxID=2490948 RepID=UPI000F8E9711|nr:VanW family protein [Veillonella sp. CHU594]